MTSKSTQTKESMRRQWRRLNAFLNTPVHFGRHLSRVSEGAIILFPVGTNRLACGLAGMIAVKKSSTVPIQPNLEALNKALAEIFDTGAMPPESNAPLDADSHFSGIEGSMGLLHAVRDLRSDDAFFMIYADTEAQNRLKGVAERLAQIIEHESTWLANRIGALAAKEAETMVRTIDNLKDAAWCLDREIFENIRKIRDLMGPAGKDLPRDGMNIYRQLNAVLNSIDCLEVRGRDSAGISLLVEMDRQPFDALAQALRQGGAWEAFESRKAITPLLNGSLCLTETNHGTGEPTVSMTLTYKIAAEIGSLGDNVRFLRRQIHKDPVLQLLARSEYRQATVLSHTRWASVGAISEANCHPVNHDTNLAGNGGPAGTIHVCLNGDIDNYQTLRADWERASGQQIHPDITTDTKIIPLLVGRYVAQGCSVTEAFRLAVNDFEGSHAICMHTDLAAGKLFLAQKGSGQAIFIGLGQDHYMATSEVYGFIEMTSQYLKMDGEKTIQGDSGPVQGQIFVLDQQSDGGLDGITAMYYDGTPLELDSSHILETELTSRDINRQDFAHYFLKEISESPGSVEKTLENRWKIQDGGKGLLTVSLGEETVPPSLRQALVDGTIRRIYFVGQGTAGVAARACADILAHYMDDPTLQVSALKASELSGFKLGDSAAPQSMADTLVVAISQSGTTTDTNRTVDMVRERGAHTLAIVNRRDSDITFKVDGVMYTSSGRDIEMSVASTKAFYGQIVAGALVGLFMVNLRKRRNSEFISSEIEQLRQIPAHMRQRSGHEGPHRQFGPATGPHQDILGHGRKRAEQGLGR